MAMKDLLELIKIRITLLSAAMAAAGYLLAGPRAPWLGLWRAAAGTALMVASASLFNMWLERRTDGRMRRTRERPLPAGRARPLPVLAGGAVAGAAGMAILFGASAAAGWVAVAALILYAFVYTPLKPKTPWAFVAGIGPGAAPPLMGWAAATGRLDGPGLLLFLWLVAWQIPHILAIHAYLRDDYGRAGISVLPGLYGPRLSLGLTLPFTAAAILFSVRLAGSDAHGPVAGAIGTAIALMAGLALLAGHLQALVGPATMGKMVAFKRATIWYASALVFGQLASEAFRAF